MSMTYDMDQCSVSGAYGTHYMVGGHLLCESPGLARSIRLRLVFCMVFTPELVIVY